MALPASPRGQKPRAAQARGGGTDRARRPRRRRTRADAGSLNAVSGRGDGGLDDDAAFPSLRAAAGIGILGCVAAADGVVAAVVAARAGRQVLGGADLQLIPAV